MIQKHKIVTNIQHLEKIIHISDIHIRLYRRHAEYIDVFNKLYDSLKNRNLNNTTIVVTGDIVHSKTDMSPEMVAVASDFLKTLADLAPTIVIAGNHDLNLSNPDRLDALSPIIDNLQHKNLHYLKTSGIYEFADVEFGVCAIVDVMEDWPITTDLDSSKSKIALYHGPVDQAKTSSGYTVTNKITVDRFDGYDMVLLGDIHTTQILQEYSGPGKPEIFYAGSLIQQNHGELLAGHGYGVWDVDTRKVEEYVEIKNSYGYHTIKLIDSTMPSVVGLPENLRLRLLVGNVDATIVKKVQAAIRRKCNVVECIINKLVEYKNSTNTTGTNNVDNIHDVEYQNVLIKDYIESHMSDVEPELIQHILDINKKLNVQIGEDELPKNISWRPIKLTFDNLFSYGEGNSINFDNMTGLYGVFSPNATGKTSAFDALCFALYDKTPRAFKGSHIMNTRADTFHCELTLEIDQLTYIIERQGTRKKTGDVKVDVNFYRLDNEDKICLNGEDRRDTNATIRSYVGTYDDFILTSLSVQNQNSLFVETGQTDRKDLLSQFIGLTVFDRLYMIASDESKEVVGALKNFSKDDFTQKLADTQQHIEIEQTNCNTLQSQITDYLAQINDIEAKIKSLYEKKNPEIPSLDIVSIQKKISELTLIMKEINEDFDNEQKHLFSLVDDLTKLGNISKNSNRQYSIDELFIKYKELKHAKELLAKLQTDIKLLYVDAANKKEKLEKLKEHKYDPNCQFCINNIFVKDAQQTQIQYDTVLQKIDKLEKQMSGSTEYINSRIDIEKIYHEELEYRDKMDILKSEHTAVLLNLERIKTIKISHQSDLDALAAKVSEYEQNEISIKANKQLELEIQSWEQKKISLDTLVKKLQNDLRQHDRELSVLQSKKNEMLTSIKNAEELETTYDAYETYLTVIGRDGLPYELISKVIPTIESEVNNILTQVVDFTITLEVDGKNINGKIIYEDDRTWPLELASGMEKFISGLAIRVALMSVSNLPRSNFLVIDEGLGVLDSENLAGIFVLFNILKTQFDFLILISHLDTVRDIADNLIEIQRDNGYSRIIVN